MPTVAKGLPGFDGKDEHNCRDWEAPAKENIKKSAPAICNLTGQGKYNSVVGSNLVQWAAQ